jgi:ParB family chromosome partitioning protein
MTHQEIADMIGRSRASVTNLLRLLELPDEAQAMLAEGKLDLGHARALLALPEGVRVAAAEQAVAQRLSVRAVERLGKVTAREGLYAAPQATERLPDWFERQFSRPGRGIRLRARREHGWCLNIAFDDLDQLRDALDTLADIVRRFERVGARPVGGVERVSQLSVAE